MEIDKITYKADVVPLTLNVKSLREIHSKVKERRLGLVELLCDELSGYGNTTLPCRVPTWRMKEKEIK